MPSVVLFDRRDVRRLLFPSESPNRLGCRRPVGNVKRITVRSDRIDLVLCCRNGRGVERKDRAKGENGDDDAKPVLNPFCAGDGAHDGGYHRAAASGRGEEHGPVLGTSTETAEAHGEDDGEDAGLRFEF